MRKNGTIYAVLKGGYPTGSASFNHDELSGEIYSKTYTLKLPPGTKRIRVYVPDYTSKGYLYYNVAGIDTLYITVEGSNPLYYIFIFKNPNDRKTLDDNHASYTAKHKFTARIEWSPEINNG